MSENQTEKNIPTEPAIPRSEEIIIEEKIQPGETASPKESDSERIQQVREEIAAFAPKEQVPTTTHQVLNSQFFSVEDYFKKGNTHKTGYSILGYEAMEPITFWRTIIESAKKYLPSKENRQRMADIGCAYGYLLKHVASYFDQTVGIDISRTALEKAKENSPTSLLIEANLNQNVIPLADRSLDMITLLDSIEHVEQPNELLKEASRTLSEGGIAIVSTPDIGNWFGRLIAKMNGDPSHISLFTQKELIAKLEQNGFTILEKHPFFPLGPFRIPVPANIEIVARKKP